jgi:hypothetical protein
MIGLHVIDNDVIDIRDVDQLLDLGEELVSLVGFCQVDDGLLFIVDQVGIVRDTRVRDGPDSLEQIGGTVDDSDPIHIGCDFDSGHIHLQFANSTP